MGGGVRPPRGANPRGLRPYRSTPCRTILSAPRSHLFYRRRPYMCRSACHWQSANASTGYREQTMAGSNSVDEAAVGQVLDAITAPRSGKGLLAAGMGGGSAVAGDKGTGALEVDPSFGPALEPLRREVESRLAALPGVAQATVVMS